jgi:hypothetical protein
MNTSVVIVDVQNDFHAQIVVAGLATDVCGMGRMRGE